MIRLAVIAAGPAVAGCNDLLGTGGCEGPGYAAVAVTVVDARTNAPAAAGATLIATDGVFAETRTMPDDPRNNAATLEVGVGRPGTYTLTVRKAGYRDWTRTGVGVTKAGCHVSTVRLTAAIEPD